MAGIPPLELKVCLVDREDPPVNVGILLSSLNIFEKDFHESDPLLDLLCGGLPEEWGTLNLLLDYPEGPVVLEVLQGMAAQVEGRSRVEKQGFGGRLRVLALTSRDEEVRRQAEELLTSL